MDIVTAIVAFREDMYIGRLLDNTLMNSILQSIGMKLSNGNLNNEEKLRLNNYLNICVTALSNKDYVFLADILYYEIMPLLKED